MSRYRIYTKDTVEVVVGWDDPMATFFGHFYDTSQENELVASCGTLPHSVPALSDLRDWLSAWDLTIPKDVEKSLEIDYERHDAWTPGPLQKALGFTGREKDDAELHGTTDQSA